MQSKAKPRWKKARFGDSQDLYLRNRWLGSVEPEIAGECRYTTRTGAGCALSVDDAKRHVESTAAKLST
jgi:hypothetical protein